MGNALKRSVFEFPLMSLASLFFSFPPNSHTTHPLLNRIMNHE